MIIEKRDLVYPPTARVATRHAFITLGVAVRFIVCLAAIGAGMYIAVRGNSHGLAVLAALGCGAVIYALLSPAKSDRTTTTRIYMMRGPFGLVARFKGDEETDARWAAHWTAYDAEKERQRRLVEE